MQTSSAHARQVSLHKLHTSVIRVLHGVRKRSKHSFDGSLLTGMVSAQDVQWQHPTSVSAVVPSVVNFCHCCWLELEDFQQLSLRST